MSQTSAVVVRSSGASSPHGEKDSGGGAVSSPSGREAPFVAATLSGNSVCFDFIDSMGTEQNSEVLATVIPHVS